MNKKGIAVMASILIVVSAIIVFLLIIVVASAKQNNGFEFGTPKVQCDVTIQDTTFGPPKIKEANCDVVGKCRFALAWYEWGTPLMFKNRGKVVMTMEGKSDSKSYVTSKLGGIDKKTLSLCTTATSGKLKITDEEGNTIDTKNFQVFT